MPLSADQIKTVFQNEDEFTAKELALGDEKDLQAYNAGIVSFSPVTATVRDNLLYAPLFANKTKYVDMLADAYVPSKDTFGAKWGRSIERDALNERRNELITLADKTEEPTLKQAYQSELDTVNRRMNVFSGDEETEYMDVGASIARSIWRSAPVYVGGAVAGAFGGAAVAVPATLVGSFLVNKDVNYNEAYAGIIDNNMDLTQEEKDERATKAMWAVSSLDAAGDLLGIGKATIGLLSDVGKGAYARLLEKGVARKVGKETLKKTAIAVGKETVKESAVEGATEVMQDATRARVIAGESVPEAFTYSVGDIVGAFARTAAGTASETDKDLVKTAKDVFLVSLLFSGGMNSRRFAQHLQSAYRQSNVEKADAKTFEYKQKLDIAAVPEAQTIIEDAMDVHEKRPPSRYADAEKLEGILREDLEREDLTETQRARETELLQRAVAAKETTGQVELTAKEHSETFLDPTNTPLFQKTNKQTFFVDPEQIENEYTLDQLTLQAVEEIDKSALDEQSAFMDVYRTLKETGQASDKELVANALQHNALMTTAATAQDKTYAELKKEHNISLKAETKDAVDDIADTIAEDNSSKGVAGVVTKDAEGITMRLSKETNPTTFSHESFHLFELLMGDAYLKGGLNPYWTKQLEKLYKGAGVQDLGALLTGTGGKNVSILKRVEADRKAMMKAQGEERRRKLVEEDRKQTAERRAQEKAEREDERAEKRGAREIAALQEEEAKKNQKVIREEMKRVDSDIENEIVKIITKDAKRFEKRAPREFGGKKPKTRRQWLSLILRSRGKRGIASDRSTGTQGMFGGGNRELYIPEEFKEFEKFGENKKGAQPLHWEQLREELEQDHLIPEGSDFNAVQEWLSDLDAQADPTEVYERTAAYSRYEQYEYLTRSVSLEAKDKSVRAFVKESMNGDNEAFGAYVKEAVDNLSSKLKDENIKHAYDEAVAYGVSPITAYTDAVLQSRGFAPSLYTKTGYEQGGTIADAYTDVQERLAEAWTEYLQTGESPKRQYEAMFAKFKEMFAPIYRNFVRAGALNRTIRDVYDRIFLSYEEAKQAAADMRIGIVRRPAGVDDETWGKYTKAKKAAVAKASDEVVKAIRALSRMETDAEYQAEKARVQAEAQARADANPDFQIQEFFATKGNPKINTAELHGLGVRDHIKGITSPKGISLDEAVALINTMYDGKYDKYSLIRVLTDVDKAYSVEYETDRAMNAWARTRYADLYAKVDAYNNMQSIDAIDAVLYEYVFLTMEDYGVNSEAFGDVKVMFERSVEKQLETTPVKKLSSEKYKQMLMANVLKQKQKGVSKDKLAEMKYQQAVLMRLVEISKRVESDVNSLAKFADKYKSTLDEDNQRSAIDAQSRELLRSILNDTGVSRMSLRDKTETSEKVKDWVGKFGDFDYRPENDINIYQNAFILLDKAGNVKYNNLNQGELSELKGLLSYIEKVAQNNRATEDSALQTELTNDSAELREHLFKEHFKNTLSAFDKVKLMGVSVPIILKEILPERLHQKYIRPFFNGLISANNGKKADFKAIEQIFGEEAKRLQENITIDGITMSKENLIVMMLNTGTVHNTRTLARTMLMNAERYGLSVRDVNNITEEEMSAAVRKIQSICSKAPESYTDIVNGVWALIDSKKKALGDAYLYATNNIMKVEDVEQLTGINNRLAGGYYPIYRKTLQEAQQNIFKQSFADTASLWTPTNVRDRTEALSGDLALTLDGLNNWVETTERYINCAKPYFDLGRFLNRDDVKAALGDYATTISEWMSKAGSPLQTISILRTLNALTDVKVLGLSPLKMARQYSGLIYASQYTGVGNAVRELAAYVSNPNEMLHPIETAKSLSPYMNDRYSDYSKIVLGGLSVARESQKGVIWRGLDKSLEKISPYALGMLTMADAQASTIAWRAQYNKSIAAGKTHAEAVFDADNVIMHTQGDASSYSRPQVMRGEMRFFMKYMTYFTSVYSSLYASRMFGNNPAARAKFAMTLINAGLLCSMYETLINVAFSKMLGDDDKDEEFLARYIKEIGSSTGNILFPFFGLGSTAGTVLAKGVGKAAGYDMSNIRTYAPSFVPLSPIFNGMTKINRVIGMDDPELADWTKAILSSIVPKGVYDYISNQDR